MATLFLPLSDLKAGKVTSDERINRTPESAKIIKRLNDEDRWTAERFARLERWVESLGSTTFETEILPLSAAEALALRRAHECGRLELQMREQSFRERNGRHAPVLMVHARRPEVRHLLDPAHRETLTSLARRVDEVIARFGGTVFVRTSGLSPKDAVLQSPKLLQMLRESITEHKREFPDATEDETLEWDARNWSELLSRAGSVQSGDEAIWLLTRSMRTFSDITGTSLHGDSSDDGVSLIVRRWESDVHPNWEFRAFVVRGENDNVPRLSTIQTYCGKSCYEPDIVAKKRLIRKVICEKFAQVRDDIVAGVDVPRIFTVDFAVLPERITVESTRIVELNGKYPHAEGPPVAGTGLFSLDNEDDVRLMERRGAPPEGGWPLIRVQEEPVKFGEDTHSHIRHFVDTLRGRDTSWTKNDRLFGTDVVASEAVPSVAVVCSTCDQVFDRDDVFVCFRCDGRDGDEHIRCAECHVGQGVWGVLADVWSRQHAWNRPARQFNPSNQRGSLLSVVRGNWLRQWFYVD